MKTVMRYLIILLNCGLLITGAQPAQAQNSSGEVVRFSSLLDNCLQIWEESCALLNCENYEQSLDMHDLLVGRLTRLSRDIARLEKENADSNSILVSDLDYLVSILLALESEYEQSRSIADDTDSIMTLSRSIRKQISQLL